MQGLDNRDWAAMAPDVFDAEDMYPNAQEAILDDLTAITDTMSAASIRQKKKSTGQMTAVLFIQLALKYSEQTSLVFCL